MLIRYGYDLEVFCPEPVLFTTLLDSHPDLASDVRCRGVFESNSPFASTSFIDSYGNEVTRFVAPAGVTRMTRNSVLECDGTSQPIEPAARQVPLEDVPPAYLMYLLGSRYCETDKLSRIAWDLFGNVAPGWARVQAICDFINRHMTFGYQYARATRTAFEAFDERVGVCRDYAHLAVTFCRCMNIPTRYANGFLGDIGVPPDPLPMDYNAWFEVYLDHRWFIFDARHNVPRIGRITVARGRDATDIPMLNSFGPHTLNSFRVWTHEVPSDEAGRDARTRESTETNRDRPFVEGTIG